MMKPACNVSMLSLYFSVSSTKGVQKFWNLKTASYHKLCIVRAERTWTLILGYKVLSVKLLHKKCTYVNESMYIRK